MTSHPISAAALRGAVDLSTLSQPTPAAGAAAGNGVVIEGTDGGFQASVVGRVSHQTVGGLERGLVHCAGARYALSGLPVTPQILEQRLQAGGLDFERRAVQYRRN